VYGVFLARTPAARDLVPRGVFPTLRGGGGGGGGGGGAGGGGAGGGGDAARRPTTFPVQCQCMLVAGAPPMPQPA
jgi:hypothetical protein